MLPALILILSLFYYMAKGFAPTVVTGKNLYPPLFVLALAALARNAYVHGKWIRPQLNHLGLLVGIAACMLNIYVLVHDPDAGRFDTSLSLYFGVFVFALLFSSLQPLSETQMKNIVTMSLALLSLEALWEILMVHVFGNTEYMFHWDLVSKAQYQRHPELRPYARATGLLGYSSNTSSFLVFLLWLYYAFNGRLKIKPALLALLFVPGFLLSFSGTGFFVLMLTLLIFMNPLARTATLIFLVPAVFYGLNAVSGFFPILGKVSLSYLQQIYAWESGFVKQFIDFFMERPSLLLFGVPKRMGWSVFADIAYLKSITDFGLAPILLNLSLFYLILKNLKDGHVSPSMLKGVKIGILSLVIGTFHYALLFSVPAQAFLGALLAYSFRIRDVKKTTLPTPGTLVGSPIGGRKGSR